MRRSNFLIAAGATTLGTVSEASASNTIATVGSRNTILQRRKPLVACTQAVSRRLPLGHAVTPLCTPAQCGGTAQCGQIHLAKLITTSTTNYVGGNFTCSNGQSLYAVDNYGSLVNVTVSPGQSITIHAYGCNPVTITSSHPAVNNQSYTVNGTTFHPVSGTTMWRWTNPKAGSGAAWVSGSWGSLVMNVIYSGFQTFSKLQAPMPSPSPTPITTVQQYCAQQAASLQALSANLNWLGIFFGAAGLIPSPQSVPLGVGSLGAGVLSTITGANASAPCPVAPNPQPGPTPTGASLMPQGGWMTISGNPGTPDGGDAGDAGDGTEDVSC